MNNLHNDLRKLRSIKAPEAMREKVNREWLGTTTDFGRWRRSTTGFAFGVIVGTVGLIGATYQSRPGDVLYPIKTKVAGQLVISTPTSIPSKSPSPVTITPTPSPTMTPIKVETTFGDLVPTTVPTVQIEITPAADLPTVPTPVIEINLPLPIKLKIGL